MVSSGTKLMAMRFEVELGRVDAGFAATNSQWVFQTSVEVILSLSLSAASDASGSANC
jgi:hypothetical protein